MINHYQKRMHTRGPSMTVQKDNEDLIIAHDPVMMRTV